jgi:exopolysaccharide biosynthesis polyprenyl glycosylphosphotransferase
VRDDYNLAASPVGELLEERIARTRGRRRPLTSVPAPSQGPKPRRTASSTLSRVSLDLATLALANLAAAGLGSAQLQLGHVILFDIVAIALLASGRAYAPRVRLDVLDDIRQVVASTAVAAMVVIAAIALISSTDQSASDVVGVWLFSAGLLAAGRIASTELAISRRQSGSAGLKTVIVGAGNVGRMTARRLLEHPEFGLQPVGFLDKEPIDVPGEPLPLPVLGASWDLEAAIAEHDVECVVISFSNAPHDVFLWLLDKCAELGIRTLVVPRLFERVPARVSVEHVGGLPLLQMRSTSPRSFQYAVKGALDRVIGAMLLVFFLPLLLASALAVLISLGRPILYHQERVGLDGRRFRMLKFRTMRAVSDPPVHVPDFLPRLAPGGVEGVDRRTRVGGFLRSTSLDELVQLINVVKGEMSLVGPRPERPEYVEYFAEHVHRYDARHRVKAGITGWAQVHRLRGKTSISDRVEWDNYYIENFSLWLDLKILLLSVPAVLRVRSE